MSLDDEHAVEVRFVVKFKNADEVQVTLPSSCTLRLPLCAYRCFRGGELVWGMVGVQHAKPTGDDACTAWLFRRPLSNLVLTSTLTLVRAHRQRSRR